MVPNKAIDMHFESKAVGECNTIPGKLDEVKYFIWAIKEADFIMKTMASGVALVLDVNHKKSFEEVD